MIQNMVRNHSLREDELHQIWGLLDERSVLLIGPRRIGKTTLLREMIATKRDGAQQFRGVRVDLQHLSTVVDAVDQILAELAKVGLSESAKAWIDRKIAAVQAGPVGVELAQASKEDRPWERLGRVLEEAAAKMREDEILFLALDEVPWWLDGLRRREGDEVARSALAALRALRQRDDLMDRMRMVLTGSVGLAGLARALGASAELNDLRPMELPPLTPVAGRSLFETELGGRSCTEEGARAAYEVAGGSPHWIKEIAARCLRGSPGAPVDEGQVDDAVTALLDPKMRNTFGDEGDEHLRRRHPQHAALLARLLSEVAASPRGAPKEGLIAVALASGVPTRRAAEELLHTLEDEFYLRHAWPSGRYTFVLPLFQRWWNHYGDAS